MKMKRILALMLALCMMVSMFVACGDNAESGEDVPNSDAAEQKISPKDTTPTVVEDDPEPDTTAEEVPELPESVEINIVSLKGPTTMGMVKLMSDYEAGLTNDTYNVAIYGTADEIVGLIVGGEADIANVPCNLASVLYNKTNGGISALGINTLGVLYILDTQSPDSEESGLNSIADLKGRTIYSTGKGTTPEYVLNYILRENGLDPEKDVTVEYLSEATEVAAKMADSDDAIAVLPQPYVTVAMSQNEKLEIAFDLTEEWKKIDGTQLVTGVTIARKEFIEAHPEAVARFMDNYAASVDYVNANTDEAAALVGNYDIVAEQVAKKALPKCNIVFQTGDELKTNASAYLNVLYESDPTSVGGQLPGDDFYYNAE